MIPSRRAFLFGAAAVSAAVVTPDFARAAQVTGAHDWTLATADVEADIAPQALRLISGRAPTGSFRHQAFRQCPATGDRQSTR